MDQWLMRLAAVAAIIGTIVQVVELARKSGPKGKDRITRSVSLFLMVFGLGIFGYLSTRTPTSTIPPHIQLRINQIRVDDTGEVIQNVSAEKCIELTSAAEHVKVILEGEAKGIDLSCFGGKLTAYSLIRPPTVEEVWYVQKRERGRISENGKFELEVYLGGTGSASAQDGQVFGVAIVAADFSPSDTYAGLDRLPRGRPLSPIYQVRVRRQVSTHGTP